MRVDQAVNFVAINDLIATAGRLDKALLLVLGSEGYEAVINLLPHDSQYAVAGEPELVSEQGIKYFYIPVDFAAPNESDLNQFHAAMDACQGKRLLIHCAANYRVSAFFGSYAHQKLGWSVRSARELIDSVWCPHDRPPWGDFVSRFLPRDR